MPTRIFGFTALYFMWCVITKVNVTEGRKLYISRSGDDKWSCDQSKPCKSIWRAVTLASRGDRIHLDGTNTSKDPYTCQTGTSQHPGIYINKSLSLIGSVSPMPQIRCIEGTGLTFNGSDNAEQMNLTLSGLLVSESFVSFQDSSVNINGCKFKGKKQSVRIVIRTSIILSIRITDSTFSRSSECISVVVNSTKSPFPSIQVMFKLTNSYFYSNVLLDEGRCISFTEFPSSNQSIRCNITLENVTFSRNKFTSKGLVLLGINNGSHHVYFQNVTFVDNSPVLGKGSLTVNGDSECIFRGTVINISINSSSFTSEYARSFSASASTISLQICNSSFLGHLAQGNGGVVSLRGTDLCNLGVSKSSFINTTAAQGGAINLECATVNSVSFEDSIFSGNTATNGGGGAVYISALKASVQLNHSAFTACTASHGGGVSIETGTNLPKIYPNNTDLLLTVESSNFTECSAHTGGGALNVYYESDVQINFNKSRFIFNVVEFGFGGAIMAFPLETATSLSRNSSTSQFTIESSTFANNLARQGGTFWLSLNSQSSLILKHVVMESNEATERFGGVAVIYDCRVKIQSSRFLNNLAGYDGGVFWIVGNVHSLEVVDSLFESNSVLSHSGGAFFIQMASVFQSILITNSTFNNCSAAYNGGAINIISGSVSLLVKRSRFTKNHCTFGSGGALHVSRPGGQLKAPGCIKNNTGNLINDVKEYNTQLIIENTVFERNSGLFGGAIYLDNGQATFNNCSFIDNFAGLKGGHIYATFGFASLAIQHSIFRQNIKILKWNNMNYSNILFIQAENILTLKLHNSTLDVRPYGSTGPLMQVTDSRLIDLGNKHLTTTFNCPVGSQMEILNITVELTTLEFSCSACAGNSYSLQRGRALGSQVAPGFQCLPCPFGANCSQNILAKPNFWGFKERLNPPTLKFTMCPLGYCSPPLKTDFPEYNGCQGNRSGELCGQCNESYTETVYSSNCRPSHNCNDFWFWPVAFVYVSFMAFYFTFKPPIVPWIKRQILWFKKHETANANEDDNFDRGYVKIVFYFYQAANLLVSSSSRHILKTKFIDVFVGLFNFQEKVSSSGLICPFPGLTVVTKQLFSASHLFGTCLMIGVFYVLHW